jgi:hypothetical protein
MFYRKFVWNSYVLQDLVIVCFTDLGQICYLSVIHNSGFKLYYIYVPDLFFT